MDALSLERVESELVLLGIVRSVVLFSYVILREEDFVDAAFLLPLHQNFDIFRLDFLQHQLILAVLFVSDLDLLL